MTKTPPRRITARNWPSQSLEDARRAGQQEFQLPLRSIDPRVRAAKAEKLALRRKLRRRRHQPGVNI